MMPRMRRRIRSAAFPVHRHSLPQLLVDGVLVALAYFLAFRLRFEGHVLTRYEDLFDATIWWVVPVALVVLAAFGLYQRLWTFVGQRDYEAVVKGVVVATLLIVGAIALLHPVQTRRVRVRHNGSAIQSTAVTLPASVIALFFLLTLALLVGARFLVHLIVEGRVRSFRVAKGARDVLIVGGGDGGRLVVRELVRNPQLRLRPVGFVDDDPRKQGMKDEYGLKVLGTTAERGPGAGPRRGRARRGRDRDPVGAGDAARAGGRRVPRARDPRPHDADRVRAAQGRLRAAARSPASCARSASRTSSAASRCGWSSSASAPTSPARSCS